MKLRRQRRHRLSMRLLLLFLVTGVLLVMVIAGLFRGAWRYHFEDAVKPHLEKYVGYLADDIGMPPDLQKAARLAEALPIDILVIGQDVRWSSRDSSVEADVVPFRYGTDWQSENFRTGQDSNGRFAIEVNRGGYRIVFLSESFERDGRGFVAMLVMIGLVLLVLFAAYRLIRVMLRPIEQLEDGVQRLGAGELDHRIKFRRKDELGTLGDAIDRMADDIEGMLDAKRELLLAISHELRSPLTRANVSLALMDDTPLKGELGRDLAEMERLISELIEAERLNARHAPLNLENVPLVDLIHDLLQEHFRERTVELYAPDETVTVSIDPVRIRLMVRNLVDNAVRHNRPERGAVRVTCALSDERVEIVVADHGEGLQDDDVARAVEPFWRGDRARQRGTGGFGLGLYLCNRIAVAHGGSMQIESMPGQGTRVTVSIPKGASGSGSA